MQENNKEAVVFPVETETLWDILQNKENYQNRYVVKARESIDRFAPIAGEVRVNPEVGIKKLANYINNLGIRVSIDTVGLTTAEKYSLLFDWLYGANICPVEEFTETVIQLVFKFKGFNVETKSIMSDAEAEDFIKAFGSYVERWVVFYDSLMVYALKQFYGHGEIDTDPSKEFVVIDESDYTPLNLVTVFEYSDFTTYYSFLDGEHFAYLKREFDTPYFAGKQLYDYFYVKDNPVAALLATTLVDNQKGD